jgi:hypothetical protein
MKEDKHHLYNRKNGYYLIAVYQYCRFIYVYIHHRNLLNKCEPKRETSNKKIRKFIKEFNKEFQGVSIMYEHLNIYMQMITGLIKYCYYLLFGYKTDNKTVSLLTGIKKKYGRDIYDVIRSHL